MIKRGSRRNCGILEDSDFGIINKGDIIMAMTENKEYVVEYRMPTGVAKTLLDARKGEEKKMHPNDYLCKVVNECYGIRGRVTRVIQY